MALPVRLLPISEHWDCHSCARCCRGSVIPLTEDDQAKIRSQGWNEHPEFRNTKILVRASFGSRRKVLAKRSDGSCVFLMDDGRCRIHLEHGREAKPGVCQAYPLQLVPHHHAAYLTLRRSCPSAAAGRGAELSLERDDIRRVLKQRKKALVPAAAPRLAGRRQLSWKDADRVFGSLARLMTASGYPMVRRLVHALLLCESLELCDLSCLDARQQGELLAMLEESVPEEASPLFRERRPPSRTEAGVVRQSVFQFLRLHPQVAVRERWRDRLVVAGAAFRFLRGRGRVPNLVGATSQATFESLESPLGPLDPEVLEPLNRFLETATASARYCLLLPRRWGVVDGFRNLAFAYVAGMWLMRLFASDSQPNREMMADIVVALDRGQGFAALTDSRHRRRIRFLAKPGQLPALAAWYAQ